MTRLFARWPLPVAVVLALLLQGALAAPCAAHGWKGHISKTKTVTVTTTTTKTCGTIAPVAVQPVAPVYAPAPVAPTAYVPAVYAPAAYAPAPVAPTAFVPAVYAPAAYAPAPSRRWPSSLAALYGARGPMPGSTRRAGCLCPCGLCPGTRGPGGSRCTSTSCAASPDTTGLGPALGIHVSSSKEMVPSIAWNVAALPQSVRQAVDQGVRRHPEDHQCVFLQHPRESVRIRRSAKATSSFAIGQPCVWLAS